MNALRDLYLNSARELCEADDPDVAFLLAAKGSEIPQKEIDRLDLTLKGLKAEGEEEPAVVAEAPAPPADQPAAGEPAVMTSTGMQGGKRK